MLPQAQRVPRTIFAHSFLVIVLSSLLFRFIVLSSLTLPYSFFDVLQFMFSLLS